MYHPHLNMRMCIGDALADALRQMLPLECPRGLPRKLNAPTQINACVITCMICMKFLEFDTRTLVCFDCGKGCCHECVAARRYWHRHQLHRMCVKRKDLNTLYAWRCDVCNRRMFVPLLFTHSLNIHPLSPDWSTCLFR